MANSNYELSPEERNQLLLQTQIVRWAAAVVGMLVIFLVAAGWIRSAMQPRTPLPAPETITKFWVTKDGHHVKDLTPADWRHFAPAFSRARAIDDPGTAKLPQELHLIADGQEIKVQPHIGDTHDFSILTLSSDGAWRGNVYRPTSTWGVAEVYKNLSKLDVPSRTPPSPGKTK